MKKLRPSAPSTVIAASALMLGMSHGATVGINWTTTFAGYGASAGAVVTQTAFGVAPADWTNIAAGASGSGSASGLSVSWTGGGNWGSGIGGPGGPGGTGLQSGAEEVFTGYLDDGGINVTISGLSSVASSYSVKLLAASDYAPNGFWPATLGGGLSGSLTFTNLDTGFGYAGLGRSAETAFSGTGTGDSFTISIPPVQISPRVRGTLAGIVIDYTPVPEPATAAFGALALGAMLTRRRRQS
jgi:MYXO-CTERM domain-containing protein